MVVESHSWEEGSVVVAGDNPGGPNMGDNRTFPGLIWESMNGDKQRATRGEENRGYHGWPGNKPDAIKTY